MSTPNACFTRTIHGPGFGRDARPAPAIGHGIAMPIRPTVPPLLWEPAPPGIETQGASAQGAANLAETALWRYHLCYWHEHRAQDEVIVTVSFNGDPLSDTTVAPDGAPPRIELHKDDDLRVGERGDERRDEGGEASDGLHGQLRTPGVERFDSITGRSALTTRQVTGEVKHDLAIKKP